MTDRATRDFRLVELADGVKDTTVGAANATIMVMKSQTKARDLKRIELAGEMIDRFVAQTMTLQSFMIDFHDGMSDADLRKWAADLKTAVTA